MDSALKRNVINHAPSAAGFTVSQRIAEHDKSRPWLTRLFPLKDTECDESRCLSYSCYVVNFNPTKNVLGRVGP